MDVSREELLQEAVARMRQIGIFPETIRQFEQDEMVSICEEPDGAFYWAEGEDLERVREFEREENAVVYCIIRSEDREFGRMDAYLFVNGVESDWPAEREDLDRNEAIAYVYNHTDPIMSEKGYIGFRLTLAKGLVRTN